MSLKFSSMCQKETSDKTCLVIKIGEQNPSTHRLESNPHLRWGTTKCNCPAGRLGQPRPAQDLFSLPPHQQPKV